ncbi:MetQ/NlpA family ABC transporter substrate-binding protein [Stackebrandtia soli]|uniref:MetQ/NlpA family ABC transporter substrate-binding protein n=1 Tax=Stackebrandtia soli TaxID=1892856 RepID=UPI0039EC027C
MASFVRSAAAVISLAVVGGVTACSGGNADDTLLVGATPAPHGQILEFIKENLAEEAGLNLEIREFTDYNQPNAALDAGDLDANFFQHQPFLDEYNKASDADLVSVTGVHVEPLGAYSSSIDNLADLPDGAQVSIPADASNGGRALKLLADNGLITLADGAGTLATEDDIVGNPSNVEIVPLEAAELTRSLEDVDLAVINGNYAIEADLVPSKDSLAIESTDDNPYVNLLVTNANKTDDPDVVALGELLNSPEVADFIKETFSDGSVIPAF